MIELIALMFIGFMGGYFVGTIRRPKKQILSVDLVPDTAVKPSVPTTDSIKVVEHKEIDGLGEVSNFYYSVVSGKHTQNLTPLIENYKERKDGIMYEEACQFASDLKHNGGALVNNLLIYVYKNYRNEFRYWPKEYDKMGFKTKEPFDTFKEAHKFRLRSNSIKEVTTKKSY